MYRIFKKFDKAEELISSFCIFLIPCILFIQLLLRPFNMGFAWFEEVLRFSFLLLVYSASVIGVKSDSHFALTFLVDKVPLRLKKYLTVLKYSVWLLLNSIIIYQSILYIQKLFIRPQTSPVLEINMAWIYMIIPIMFTLQIVRLIQFFIKKIQETHNG